MQEKGSIALPEAMAFSGQLSTAPRSWNPVHREEEIFNSMERKFLEVKKGGKDFSEYFWRTHHQ